MNIIKNGMIALILSLFVMPAVHAKPAKLPFVGSAEVNLTSAVNNGEKHLVDFIRQPDGKSLGILGQVT